MHITGLQSGQSGDPFTPLSPAAGLEANQPTRTNPRLSGIAAAIISQAPADRNPLDFRSIRPQASLQHPLESPTPPAIPITVASKPQTASFRQLQNDTATMSPSDRSETSDNLPAHHNPLQNNPTSSQLTLLARHLSIGQQPGFFPQFPLPIAQQPGLFPQFPLPIGHLPTEQQPVLFAQLSRAPLVQMPLQHSAQEFLLNPNDSNTEETIQYSAPGKARKPRRNVRMPDASLSDHTDKLFQCTNCDPPKNFDSGILFSSHCKTSHPGQRIKCPFEDCKKDFRQANDQTEHVRYKHLLTDRFSCGWKVGSQMCLYRTSTLEYMRQHYLGQHCKIHTHEKKRRLFQQGLVAEEKNMNPDKPNCIIYKCSVIQPPDSDLVSNQSLPENES